MQCLPLTFPSHLLIQISVYHVLYYQGIPRAAILFITENNVCVAGKFVDPHILPFKKIISISKEQSGFGLLDNAIKITTEDKDVFQTEKKNQI